MRTRLRQYTVAALLVLLAIAWAPCANAFLPRGGFDSFGVLRYATWKINDFDTNNDGDVTAGEGLPIMYEGGPMGFTEEEMVAIDRALQVWEDVPDAYAAFKRGGVFEDPLPATADSEPDYIPTFYLQVEDDDAFNERVEADPAENQVGGLGGNLVGTVLTGYTLTDFVTVPGPGEEYLVSSGTILDVDIVIGATYIRQDELGQAPLVDLEAVMVHAVGQMLGLAWTPLNNLRAVTAPDAADDAAEFHVESPVFWMTGFDGSAGYRGVTPTMFPSYFFVDNGNGRLESGWLDLAPDDISAVSFLYPRKGQVNYYTIEQEARTHTRPGTGLPSLPIPGGHVVAWADIDNDAATPRIPMFSTMTGLYIEFDEIEDQKEVGRFSLHGLWKQFELPQSNGEKFDANYTLSLSPLNETGVERQAPEAMGPGAVDSIQGPEALSFSITSRGSDDYDTTFPSEIFHEAGNVFDITNYDAGTPLRWDVERGTVISIDTEKTLAKIVPGVVPMFGDPNDVCPLNILSDGSATSTSDTTTVDTEAKILGVTKGLRGFRDDVLLRSAIGAALVEVYYRAAPTMAGLLLSHGWLYRGVRTGFGWMIMHWHLAVLASILLVALFAGLPRFLRRHARAVMTSFFALALLIPAIPASAMMYNISTEDLVEGADHVLKGEVRSAESRWGLRNRWIYTDVVLKVDDTAKGALNKKSNVVFSVIGGIKDGLATHASGIPTFREGDQVVVYLKELADGSMTVHGGIRGHFLLRTDPETGEQTVVGDDIPSTGALEDDQEAMDGEAPSSGEAADGEPADGEAAAGEATEAEAAEGETKPAEKSLTKGPRIPALKYMDYLRGIARGQRRGR